MSIRVRNAIRKITTIILVLCAICCALVLVFSWIWPLYSEVNEYWHKPIDEIMPHVSYARMAYTPNNDNWDIYFKGDQHTWSGYFSNDCLHVNRSNLDLLNMFKKCYSLHKNPNQLGTKGYVFYVGTNPRSEHFYAYIPETGEIGSGDKWMFVPNKLKVYLQRLIMSKHLPLNTYPNPSDADSHTIDASKPNKTINKPTKTDIEIVPTDKSVSKTGKSSIHAFGYKIN